MKDVEEVKNATLDTVIALSQAISNKYENNEIDWEDYVCMCNLLKDWNKLTVDLFTKILNK